MKINLKNVVDTAVDVDDIENQRIGIDSHDMHKGVDDYISIDDELPFIKRFADKKHKKEIDYYLLNTIEDLYVKNNYDVYYEKMYYNNLYIYSFIFYEIYRTVVCVFLIVFVPQNCKRNNNTNGSNTPCIESQSCGFFDNIYDGKPDYDSAMTISIVTFSCFLFLYAVELYREKTLKKYLKYNKFDRTGIPGINNIIYNEEITEYTFTKKYDFLPQKDPVYNNEILKTIREKIIRINRYYKWVTVVTFLIYIANVISSTIVISNHSMGMKTYSVLCTYVIILLPKLYGVYKIIFPDRYHTDCITFSAFNRDFIDYNELKKKYQDKVIYQLQDEYIHIYKRMYQYYIEKVEQNKPLYLNHKLYVDEEWEEFKKKKLDTKLKLVDSRHYFE